MTIKMKTIIVIKLIYRIMIRAVSKLDIKYNDNISNNSFSEFYISVNKK